MSSKIIRVLICDDSALVRQILTSVLSSDPQIEIVGTASNPLIARQKIKQLQPDVLTLDIEMPEMDGYTLTAEIKSMENMRKMPVILHTSLSGVFNNAMVEKVGAEDFIPKFHPDELATAVKKWLKKDEIT